MGKKRPVMNLSVTSMASASPVSTLTMGRVTIPAEIREQWNLKEKDRVLVWNKGNALVMVPWRRWEEIKI